MQRETICHKVWKSNRAFVSLLQQIPFLWQHLPQQRGHMVGLVLLSYTLSITVRCFLFYLHKQQIFLRRFHTLLQLIHHLYLPLLFCPKYLSSHCHALFLIHSPPLFFSLFSLTSCLLSTLVLFTRTQTTLIHIYTIQKLGSTGEKEHVAFVFPGLICFIQLKTSHFFMTEYNSVVVGLP